MVDAMPGVPATQHADVAGTSVAYRVWGDGDPVLLIHGITSSSLSWVRVGPALGKRYRVIALDNKGHGESARPERGYLVQDQANEADALLEHLGIDRAPVIGHSWGGAIALLLATTSSRVSRLLLEDPALVLSEESRARVAPDFASWMGLERSAAETRVRTTYPQWPEADVHGKIHAAVHGSPDAVRAIFSENTAWDLRPAFASLEVPALLVRAETDLGGIVNAETVTTAEAAGVKVVTVPGADHSIHRSRFDEFMALAEKFLRGE
jgi:pimeloyl-ACP methyl ester carboxylesterase